MLQVRKMLGYCSLGLSSSGVMSYDGLQSLQPMARGGGGGKFLASNRAIGALYTFSTT